MGKVKSTRKASGKTVKGRGTNQRKSRNVSSGRVSYDISSKKIFSLFDEFRMFTDSTLKKLTDTNSLNDASNENKICKCL